MTPVAQMHLRRCQPSESRELTQWIKDRHYTHATQPGYRFALEFVVGTQRVGGMLLGIPVPPLDKDRIIELTRMYFIDDTAACTESHALSMMRKFIRTWAPGTRLLLAYSDPEVGHGGIVYEADGWCPFGMTNTKTTGYGWGSPHSRHSKNVTPKQRWVRTP